MIKEIKLPDLGEGIDGAEISEVPVAVGDTVSPEDTVLVLESDKASMEIPSEMSGVVSEILISEGEEVTTGQLLLKIEVEEGSVENEKSAPEKIEDVPKEDVLDHVQKPTFSPDSEEKSSSSVFASPGVRRLARELGINLEVISGSGQKGRITKDDLHGYIKLQMSMSGGTVPKVKKEIDFSKWGDIELQKLTKVNRITGDRLQQAWQEIPHVTQHNDADITELEKVRKQLKEEGSQKDIKVTFLPFLLKAVITVLKEVPKFNSSLDHTGENLVLKQYYHIGIAVDTPHGLTVPVVKDVDKKDIFELSKDLMDLSEKARNKKLKPEDLQGGTFTVSSLGGIGGTAFSPIVNPPEVAILGVSKSEWRPVYDLKTEEFIPRYIMPFSISYDHRVVDGAAGASFVERFSQALKDTDSMVG